MTAIKSVPLTRNSPETLTFCPPPRSAVDGYCKEGFRVTEKRVIHQLHRPERYDHLDPRPDLPFTEEGPARSDIVWSVAALVAVVLGFLFGMLAEYLI